MRRTAAALWVWMRETQLPPVLHLGARTLLDAADTLAASGAGGGGESTGKEGLEGRRSKADPGQKQDWFLKVSSGWESLSSRCLWADDALLLSTSQEPKP